MCGRISTLIGETTRAGSLGVGVGSKLRLGAGPLTERTLRHLRPRAPSQRLRTVRVGALEVSYRLNAGDIQGIREVLVDEVYRLPFDANPSTIIDLGANIGLTSLYYGAKFAHSHIVAVEPDPENATIARRNLAQLGAQVVEAAVAPKAGWVRFLTSEESNLGHVDPAGGLEVRAVTMSDLLHRLPGGRADLVKIDIEGGEELLFSEDCSWLDRVDAIIIELHPLSVDAERIVKRVERAGFRYLPAGDVWPGSMDAFVRSGGPGAR